MLEQWFSRSLWLLLAALSMFSSSVWANTESRLALLIGNATYKSSPLSNPVNDVRLMENALKEAGFTVIKAENASIRDMRRLVRDFGDKLKASGGVGLFYFAGHGVQVRGENFLVSTDSDIRNEDEVADDALNANVILEKMQTAGNRMNLIILDACRNNPFAVKSRSASSGLATMSAPSGSLVAYSTAPGSVASDGAGNNGLYTEYLAKVIRQPGLPVEEVFKQVRASVRRASNNQQTPWENTALEGQFFFKTPLPLAAPASTPAAPVPVAAPAAKPTGPDPVAIELALWDSVKSASTAGEIQSYINRYPSGIFADVARARIAAIGSNASDKAAYEKAANERAVNERAAAEASLKAATERANASKSTDPLALDMAFWESVKGSQRPSELQAYLIKFPEGAFALLAKARIEEIKTTAPSSKPSVSQELSKPPLADGVVGTLVITDSLSGQKRNLLVKIDQVDADKTSYSSGDIISKSGQVLQVRLGDAIARVTSGSLWGFPLKAGTNGDARIRRVDVDYESVGTVSWKTISQSQGTVQIEATVSYMVLTNIRSQAYGKWVASYAADELLPNSFSTAIRVSGFPSGHNTVSASFNAK